MKKQFSSLIVVLLFFLFSCGNFVLADRIVYVLDNAFVFPSSLELIEEEAFENTSIRTVVFPYGFRSVGKNVFRDTDFLTEVYVSDTIMNIEDTAFPANTDFSFFGIAGSYAEEWARKSHIPFIVCDIWNGNIENGQSGTTQQIYIDYECVIINPDKIIEAHEREANERESKRPQDCQELNSIDYRFP